MKVLRKCGSRHEELSTGDNPNVSCVITETIARREAIRFGLGATQGRCDNGAMAHAHPHPVAPPPRSGWRISLTQQIVLGLVIGCLIGWWMSRLPQGAQANWDLWLKVPRDIFL